jgi:hypothetical protein
MNKDLTNSDIDRQNILNNPFAISALQEQLDIKGVLFDGEILFSTQYVAEYYEIDIRTLQRYLENNDNELRQNGYKLFTGSDWIRLKKAVGSDMDVVTKTTIQGMFNFRSFLNLGMLLTTSQRAREVRSKILDIVLQVMSKRLGNKKYINQKDPTFASAALRHFSKYHPALNQALRDCVDMGNTKYPYFNDKIYYYLFNERFKEYKELLSLKEREVPTDTHYVEVITLISQLEMAFADEIEHEAKQQRRKITKEECANIFDNLVTKKLWEPVLIRAREVMASRDYGLRDITHDKLEEHISSLSPEEYQTYLNQNNHIPIITNEERKRIEAFKQSDLFDQYDTDKDIYERMKDK